MTTVVTVQFRPVGRTYDFNAHQFEDLKRDDYLIVEGKDGPALVQVVQPPHSVQSAANRPNRYCDGLLYGTGWNECGSRILKMKHSIYGVMKSKKGVFECASWSAAITLTEACSRFPTKRLAKVVGRARRGTCNADMSRRLRTRVEMREVRDREVAKLVDGVGKCGRQLCCTTWLREFRHIRPEMARRQQLTENRDEITGVCGRLLCCLSYEDEMYRSLTKSLPKVGAQVVTPQGAGKVRYIFPLKKL